MIVLSALFLRPFLFVGFVFISSFVGSVPEDVFVDTANDFALVTCFTVVCVVKDVVVDSTAAFGVDSFVTSATVARVEFKNVLSGKTLRRKIINDYATKRLKIPDKTVH